MADPKKPQKAGHASSRNASDATDPTAEKSKHRDKYKSDVPLQANQSVARTPQSAPSPKADRDWADAVLKGTKLPPEDILFKDSQNGSADPMMPDTENICTREMDYLMTPEEDGDNEMILNLKDHMWSIHKELKRRKGLASWNKLNFLKEWVNNIVELMDNDETKKPVEPTIAYLAETNAYLTRKLSKLEKKTSSAPQPQTQDPAMQATPMMANALCGPQ